MTLSIKKINTCDVYMLLGWLYSLQNILYHNPIINQFLILLLIIWGLIIFTKECILAKQESRILKATKYLILMYCCYGLLYILSSKTIYTNFGPKLNNINYLKLALDSLLPIFVIYYYSKVGKLTIKRIQLYAIIFTFIYIIQFFYTKENLITIAIEKGSFYEGKEFTNNVSYYFLRLFPFLFFFKNKAIKYSLLATIYVFIILGMKRGPMIIGFVCTIYFLYTDLKSNINTKQIIASLCLITLSITGGILYFKDRLNQSTYLVERIYATQEGNSSGRDQLFSTIIDELENDPSPIHLLFGRGADSTVEVAGNFAHNDWLEVACNNGLLGVILLITFYWSLYKSISQARKLQLPKYQTYTLSVFVFIYFTQTLFSMSITDMGTCPAVILGYIAYQIQRHKKIEMKSLTYPNSYTY